MSLSSWRETLVRKYLLNLVPVEKGSVQLDLEGKSKSAESHDHNKEL
jgi:hypothetical protein